MSNDDDDDDESNRLTDFRVHEGRFGVNELLFISSFHWRVSVYSPWNTICQRDDFDYTNWRLNEASRKQQVEVNNPEKSPSHRKITPSAM